MKLPIVDVRQPVNWQHPLNRGLVAWYRALPMGMWGGSSTVRDLKRISDGTISGAMWSTNAPTSHNGSLKFSGSQHVACGAPVGASTVTVACWCYPAVTTRGDLVNRWNTGGTATDQFDLLYGLTSLKPQFYISQVAAGGVTSNSGASSIVMTQNAWNHVVGVCDASTVYVYVNGALGASAAISKAMNSTGLTNIWIGDNQGLDGSFTGNIDDARVINRAFSAFEVRQLYSVSRQQFDPTLNWLQTPSVKASSSGGIVRQPLLTMLGCGA